MFAASFSPTPPGGARFAGAGSRSMRRRPVCGTAGRGGEDGDMDQPAPPNRLEEKIRRKRESLLTNLAELGPDGLEERLQSSVQTPSEPRNRFSQLIQDTIPQGRPALVLEVVRPSTSTTTEDLVELAEQYVLWGADALCVPTDIEASPTGLKDLFVVSRASKVPVLARDWYIHPIQIADAKDAGAAGVLGVIASVSSKGAPIMSSFAAAIGLDAPVEVVNATEVKDLGDFGVSLYAINLSVRLSLSIPGFAEDISKGIITQLPFGAVSLLGVQSLDEAVRGRAAGADALLLKEEMLARHEGPVVELLDKLKYLTSGDD